jgi:hypothetical protein
VNKKARKKPKTNLLSNNIHSFSKIKQTCLKNPQIYYQLNTKNKQRQTNNHQKTKSHFNTKANSGPTTPALNPVVATAE